MVKANFKNNATEYKKQIRYTVMVLNKKQIVSIAFFGVGLLVILSAFFGLGGLIIPGIFIALTGIVYYLTSLLTVKNVFDKITKKFPNYDKVSSEYTFTEENITLKTTVGKKSEENIMKYSDLYKVCETKEYFYLYANGTFAFIISKKGIIEGSEEELIEILKKNVEEKRLKLLKR